ncbi:hypothetical protein [Rhodococcus sp. (in: high G+C Gram-positive bacteria)]|uniref:hypothetical protein n=1 Tax=Rhodococcus sp. TaxID=1831 RepID=UPI003B8A915C
MTITRRVDLSAALARAARRRLATARCPRTSLLRQLRALQIDQLMAEAQLDSFADDPDVEPPCYG